MNEIKIFLNLEIIMIQHYIKTALRGILRNKQYFIINVIGLAVALSTVILIALFVRDEMSYDKWLNDYDLVYKIESTIKSPGSAPVKSAYSPGTMAPSLINVFESDLDGAVRIYENETSVRVGSTQFNEKIHYVDAGFFDIFDLSFILGAKNSVFANSNNIAISERMALKYFGNDDPIGKIFDINHSPSSSRIDYRVVAVFKDLPINSHLNSTFIALLDPSRYMAWPWVTQDWNSLTNHTYIKLKSHITIDDFAMKFSQYAKSIPITAIDSSNNEPHFSFSFINMADIHLYSTALRPFKPGGDIMAVNSFSLIAILILIMASINFTNLSSAQAIKRSKEVSIRKILGANRKQLIVQFLGETILTSLLAMLISVAIVEMLLPTYNIFLAKDISIYPLTNPTEALYLIGFSIFVGICAGIYPAFISSSFRPATILSSSKSVNPGSVRLRHILLVVQFTISISLIISMMIIYAQTLYSQNIDAGFKKENRMTLTGAGYNQVTPASHILKQQLAKIPGVKSVGISSDSFPNNYGNFANIKLSDQKSVQTTNVQTMYMDEGFLQTYAVSALAGRLYSSNFGADFENIPANDNLAITRGAIINESLLKLAGYNEPQDAIGAHMSMGRDRITDITIVGVINDLHITSTRQSPTPMIYFATKSGLDFITLELEDGYNSSINQQISAIWTQHLPNVPMIANLTSDVFNALYIADTRRAIIFAIFAALSIIISSIGLYGLAAFIAESRTREIGIRKVLGATVFDIVKLLLLQFSKPILFANVIAWPLAYLNMADWLSSFAYRIDMSLAYFIFAGLITLIIAWAVVAGHAIKVARANPIKALRVT